MATRENYQLRARSNLLRPGEVRREYGLLRDELSRLHPYMLSYVLLDDRVRRYGRWSMTALQTILFGRKRGPDAKELSEFCAGSVMREAVILDGMATNALVEECTDQERLRIRDYCAIVGVGRRTLYDWECQGELNLTHATDLMGRPAVFIGLDEAERIGQWKLPLPLRPAE